MKRYAILNENQDIIEVISGFDAAKVAAEKNPRAQYVRPVDEDETEISDDIVVCFGNSHAFAIK